MAGILIRSTAFNDHDLMPDRFSRDGGNLSPPLAWSGVPESATELVLLVEDPDAGREPFLHWLVTGIDPASQGTDEGQLPGGGREWTNGYGSPGWGGPHPPKNDDPHRYFFRLYAVDKPLALPTNPGAQDIHRAVEDIELASANMVGTFAR
ncbi:YbhB/YbcL family Raf kinase inhibitor-like protein [Micromonospora zhanjiangensis]|uniref:YbhB/YbcL family Raf kinase inhibitor-like protein n=1 Tax=Micromonospora zhanjiangensis TaxID=1522057 RepID=A0ABV8KUH4_9ACTN